jgi:hypothetical protein
MIYEPELIQCGFRIAECGLKITALTLEFCSYFEIVVVAEAQNT